MTDRSHGDLGVAVDLDVVTSRRRSVVDAPWSWLHQEHGDRVHVVEYPGHRAGATGDGLCTTVIGAPISVQVADCAPVALVDPAGIIGVAHAGWRGLLAGVLTATIDTMRNLGAGVPVAVLGPCIRPQSYEFGAADLESIAERLGPTVVAVTADGAPALDLAAGVVAALAALGVTEVVDHGGCTATDSDRRWSHRARGDRERQAMVVWLARPDAAPEGGQGIISS